MKKLLVANRSEIAIRVLRAATELGLRTVAIYSKEDRFALHRFKADEAYLVGEDKGPVQAYLDIDSIIAVAKRVGVDAIHPGYGFLAENPAMVRACDAAGIKWVGPKAEMLDAFGDKLEAKKLAMKANVPTVPGTEDPMEPGPKLMEEARRVGFPLMVKASFGGGGRGMRVVQEESELEQKLEEAAREAGGAFGNPEVFIERYIARAKHIEVQVLGDEHGNIVHLWERDCTIQRRHQKVIEIAPSPTLDKGIREALCEAAVRLVKQIDYINAGTVEFLVDADTNEFFFIEVNPRVQVEHTVTELVTGVDIVQSQIMIAQGKKLDSPEIGIPPQDQITTRGIAMQCRITTEDPENRFIPDYGKIASYRSPAGFGVRLDGGTAYSGANITPFYDSLLVKLTCWGRDFSRSIQRMNRALREFRVRGVKTNILFLENLIAHNDFVTGKATTTFIDTTPELFKWPQRRDRATKLLNYIGDVAINGNDLVKGRADGRELTPPSPPTVLPTDPIEPGTRDLFKQMGAKKFAQWVRDQKKLLLTDTTFRDAHQSLLATRVRTYDMMRIAPFVATRLPQLFSLEMWGGATFDTSMRFLKEDPFVRLDQLRKAIPNILFQMLIRAGNAVGYTNYPDDVVKRFVKGAAERGIDVFRIFDALNWLPNLKGAMEATNEAGAICEASICYTGDILDPKRDKYPLTYYVEMARELEKMGAHIIAIKDMAGLCKPFAARKLITALRDEVSCPIHFHTHDTAGVQSASQVQAADVGVDVIDAATSSMSGTTSQPNLDSLVAAMQNTERETGLDIDSLNTYSDYWQQTRKLYYPFESKITSSTAEIYKHEMPGGQATNLMEQANSLGLGHRWHEVAETYAEVNQLFGDIVKVTPTSKVVGDMALFMVSNDLTPEDVLDENRDLAFPASVVDFFGGRLGQPYKGFPEKLQKIVLRGEAPWTKRAGEMLPDTDFDAVSKELEGKIRRQVSEEDLLCYLMYPQVFVDYNNHHKQYQDTSVLPTEVFFYAMNPGQEITCELEQGKSIIIKYLATGEPDADGIREVFFELNGQPRSVRVADKSLGSSAAAHVKADPDNEGHVPAPMPGKVSSIAVKEGQTIAKGDKLLTMEAMKMEAAVYAPIAGTVSTIHVKTGSTVENRDLLVEITAGSDVDAEADSED